MSVAITYECGGCGAKETRIARIERETLSRFSVDGEPWVKQLVTRPTIENVAPADWVPYDPYTSCCYCPACWASIEEQAG